jgi:hypothetical protein
MRFHRDVVGEKGVFIVSPVSRAPQKSVGERENMVGKDA